MRRYVSSAIRCFLFRLLEAVEEVDVLFRFALVLVLVLVFILLIIVSVKYHDHVLRWLSVENANFGQFLLHLKITY